jgi:hypothetical protein
MENNPFTLKAGGKVPPIDNLADFVKIFCFPVNHAVLGYICRGQINTIM